MRVAEVDTPALLVDRRALDANIAALALYVRTYAPGVRLRPHAKTHKSPDIARRQVAAGAVGVCCQTVGEMEAMVAGGIADVVLTNQVANAGKAGRLAALVGQARVTVCIDHPAQVSLLAAAARAAGTTLGVLVEIDVGGKRCGASSVEMATILAGTVTKSAGLHLTGLQAYHGRAQHMRTSAERRNAIAGASNTAADIAKSIRRSGIICETITGAGTGTFEFEVGSNVYTELQCGSYVFMDADYSRNVRDDDSRTPSFQQSLTVLTTVISTPASDRAVCDAGLKAMSLDSGPPSLALHPGLAFVGASDEHSTLHVQPGVSMQPGDQVRIVPGHCDPTVALHDWLVAHEDGVVTDLWPIARGW